MTVSIAEVRKEVDSFESSTREYFWKWIGT